MQFHNVLTLRWKILLGVIIASALSVIMASVIYVSLQQARISDAMTRESKVLTEVVGGNVRGALAFDDSDTAMEALRTFKANQRIIGAVVYSGTGKLFATYRRNSPTDTSATLPAGFPSDAPANLPTSTWKSVMTSRLKAIGSAISISVWICRTLRMPVTPSPRRLC